METKQIKFSALIAQYVGENLTKEELIDFCVDNEQILTIDSSRAMTAQEMQKLWDETVDVQVSEPCDCTNWNYEVTINGQWACDWITEPKL